MISRACAVADYIRAKQTSSYGRKEATITDIIPDIMRRASIG